MKNNLLWGCFLTIIVNNPLSACDIVNKRELNTSGRVGIEGNCSNNGEKIECYEEGEYYGGIICDSPEGAYSGYYLKGLIYSACGCSPEDMENIDEQMEQELEER